MNLEFDSKELELQMTDDSVEQMLSLAERIREANGGELDDLAIQAVAEASGAPVEYVRPAVKMRWEKEKKSFLTDLVSQYRTLEPRTKRFLISGGAATSTALLLALDERSASHYGIFSMLATICTVLGLYNVVLSRESKSAIISGAVLFGGSFFMRSVFEFIVRVPPYFHPSWFLPVSVFGACLGALLFQVANKHRSRLGLKDPVKERQDMLKELNSLQDKLSSGMQYMTFLSVDVVGSTRMKEAADPLAVEFTFNEYYEFVTRVAQKYGGRIHSTAGDGLTCAFENPQLAFSAAKNIQAGIIELNTLRNRIGIPMVLRCGIDVGPVISPDRTDVKSVNFSHVIDIAAHLQKLAPPGGIAVSEGAAIQLPGGAASVGVEKVEAMNISGFVWVHKSKGSIGRTASFPPFPIIEAT